MGTLPDDPPGPDSPLAGAHGKLWWDRAIFLTNEGADGAVCPPVVDVTGRARILIYGPNRQLAQGVWRATVVLHLSRDAALRRIGVDFGPGPDFTTVELPLGVEGDHRAELTLTVRDERPVEVRLSLKKAAFHGEIRFAGVSLERVADPPPANLAEGAHG